MLTSRIQVPLGARGEPDYSLLAGGIAMGAMWVAMLSASSFALESQLLHDNSPEAYTVIGTVTLVVSYGVFFAARAVFRRFGARWWHIAVATVVLCCAVTAAPKAAAYVFPDPMARYHRELGGPGHCLGSTAYASENDFPKASQITYSDQNPGRMTVTPIDRAYPPLILDHAVRGGLHRLTPANAASSKILKSYGC